MAYYLAKVALLVAATVVAAYVMTRDVERFNGARFDLTDRGRGMLATRDFAAGEMIEACPLVVGTDFGTTLDDYTFMLGEEKSALALGHCSLYNHADDPNVDYSIDEHSNLMTLRTTRKVKKGEELMVSYGKSRWTSRDLKPI